MTRKTILLFIWLLLVAFYMMTKGIIPGWNNKASDFNNYYASSKLLIKGQEIHKFYDIEWFDQQAKNEGIEAGAKFSPFPPLTAVLYTPLTIFNLLTAKRIWLIMNLGFLLLIPFRIRKLFGTSLLTNAFWLSLFFVPLSSNFNFGQAYLFFGYILIEAVGLGIRNRKNAASILIGFCASLKYFPIVFVAYLFKKKAKNMQSILVFLLTIAILFTLFIILDPLSYTEYFNALTSHTQGNLPGQGKYAIAFQSIDSLLNNLFVFDVVENPNPFLDWSVAKLVIKSILFLLLGGACFHMFKRDKYEFNHITISIAVIGAFVLIPASASYHFLLLIFPVAIIGKWLTESSPRIPLLFIIALLLFTFSVQHHHIPKVPDLPTFDLLIHYPRFFGALFLFSYLYYIRIFKTYG